MRTTSAVAIAILLTSTAIPALAQTVGGNGGNAGGAGTGGPGGASAATVPGTGGSNGLAGAGGGGGGGAGTAGGVGGTGAGPSGGTGVAVAGANGNAGGANSGGGGGTGGDHGAVVTITSSNAGAITGGNGGNGGAGGSNGGGGGGAAGGYGVVLDGAGITYTNSGTITAGNGGAGGAASSAGAAAGNGGGGGYGVFFNTAATLSNSGTITGGNGGAAGATSGGATAGSVGLGGQGIIGSGVTIINSGTITGGLNGDGVTRVDAILFQSGSNTLTLQSGSVITGNIELDGNASVTFNQSTAQTLTNVITGVGGSVIQSGTAALTLSGANTYTGGTTINIATLAVANNAALGTGTLQIAGGTLQAGANNLTISNAVQVANNGGTIDTNGNNLTLAGAITDQGAIPGLFTKIGAGTLTLSAANSYSGGTEVERGTLLISGAGTLGATTSAVTVTSDGLNPAGILDLGGTTQTQNGAGGVSLVSGTIQNGTLSSSSTFALQSGTVSANLAGSAPLTKTTSGTVTLSGANTYTGATTISAGTLAISGAGSIAASSGVTDNGAFDISAATGTVSIVNLGGTGTVALGANTLALTSASGTFDGTIAGTGGLSINGGSYTLSASNGYTGTTTIASGANLALSGAGAIASSHVTDNGTFDISAASGGVSIAGLAGSGTLAMGANSLTLTSASGTFSGVISGSGGLSITGGTETLSGVNTYTGATTIASGATLALSGAGSIAASSGLADNGTFDISATTAGVSIRTLSGNGAVKLGSNTLTLSNAGGTFSGVISGTGGLTLGAGAETLSGTNTYTGTTTVSAGTLTVLGSLAGPVTVAGGKLNGTGTVGAINVTSGTLAPGDAIGVLHANGNVALGNGTTFASEVSPTAADELVATGNVTIGSGTTLAITQDAGTYSAHDYTLISAAGVSGTFTTVTGASFTGLNSTIQYSVNAVDLILSVPSSSPPPAGSPPPPPPGSPPSITFLFGTFGQTPNQIAAGNALTASPSTAALYTSLGSVVSGGSAIPATLAQLSGDIHASLRGAIMEDGKIIRDTVINHAIQGGDTVTLWAAGFGAYGTIDSDSNADAIHHNNASVIIGADAPVADGLNLGAGLALTSQRIHLPTESASASGSTNHVIGYANWTDQTWVASLGVDYGWGSNRVVRQITAFSETDSDHQSNRLTQVFGEVGYRMGPDIFGSVALEPYLNLANVSARTGNFAETGGVAALNGSAKSGSENYLTLGLRVSAPSWSVGDFGVVPDFNIGWQHAFTRFLPAETLTFAETSQSFTVLGVPLDTNAATIQAGLDVSLSPAAILSIGYDGEISNRVEDHAVRAGLSWKF